MQPDPAFVNHALEDRPYPWLDIGGNAVAAVDHIYLCSDPHQLKSCIYRRVAAPDNRDLHAGIRVGFSEVMGNLGQIFARNANPVRLIEVTGRDDDG
ncbi:hypothetical protein D3C71_1149110 [compost metagenome]